ncbi:site-specific integrase [Actinoplanes sp. TBRC 11911]|nr:site-specific integrase [Actinoplanes sp. TBRC 11911]
MYRRCACRAEQSKRQLGARCPQLVDELHGRWYFALQMPGPDERRVRVRRGGFSSRADAERACWEFRETPGNEAAGMWTVRRWLEFWLSVQKDRVRPSTMVMYGDAVRLYLIPALGHHKMRSLRPRDAQRAMDKISRSFIRGGRLISPGSLNGIRAVLRTALAEARRQGVIHANPARGLRLPSGAQPLAVVWDDEREKGWKNTGARPRVAVWDLHHVGGFLSSVQTDPLFALWWLVALRGPRRGEVVGLRWEDVDLAAGEITIREQVVLVRGVEIVGPPKSAGGVRVLTLDRFSVALLSALWREQKRRFGWVSPKDRVFVHADGRRLRPDWVTRRFTKLVDELGLPPVRFHDLRHGAAGIGSAAGMDLKQIQQDLGHSNPWTTVKTYATVFKQIATAAVQKSADLLLSHVNLRADLASAYQA